MSHSQMQHEIEGLLHAGWSQDRFGNWTHFRVGGLHSLKSAIAITSRWAN